MTTITKLLVANRGEIAARVMRTARELDIATVAVYSDPDADGPFVAAADEAVRLPGALPGETYLRGDLVIAAARRTGADAIHPGYGFLSENAEFARDCARAGLTFVGPPPAAIEAMGSKTRAKELMAASGVPVLPGLVVDEALAADPGRLAREAAALELPLLVKAVYGGGGRGMRIVRGLAELAGAVEAARREAAAAFGNGAVFLEHYVERPRHIEVQIFADSQGDVVHLFERECSIQRRYQKIIEEAPSVAVDAELRARLGTAAIAAARAIGYVGAGTVEFVLDPSGQFYFLEVNTRLQVEHPVTEEITGLDLVALQLRVAEGRPLPPEAHTATITGHAVEARLYAEDVPAGFLPSTGVLHRFEVPAVPGVRVDSGVVDGSVVGMHYDPMLAKVIAHGATREQAIRRLATALAGTRTHGVTTNRALLVAILREAEFRAGTIDTGYLDRHDPAVLGAAASAKGGPAKEVRATHLVAAALAAAADRRAAAILPGVPAGWRNVASAPQKVEYDTGGEAVEVTYRHRGTRVDATVAGSTVDVELHHADARLVDLTVDGVRSRIDVMRVEERTGARTVYLDGRGASTVAREVPRFVEPGSVVAPGSLTAPMPGTIVRLGVAAGHAVAKGAVVVVLEAMKMEHTITAPVDGVVAELNFREGDAVDSGSVLALIAPAPAPAPAAEADVARAAVTA
ncbi:HlyD family efflux transporter periplasmic adaptor subunit [Frankia sp. AgB1.9]|uniref:ATP-binding protein n=1 Tax=unclassified Frankia TaxID=2632575 RepID=UPI001932701A|nr:MULTISPECIES: biotin carboxylase N-terminal domain-containing protein [unclassified Frankia]MBL7486847.1 HlyD family efflux transporter periplasmic adaptor subunit [Frankia sp. AgW1.1]MBL7549780.1 HlyD family efflux transporter periplasmic adaptor subunit [Frankia sp. AgB1.9]MBL7622910.1 HlyD family efflux transporter periplasmic adaptor subunit [Frankia sp. AgB1.8]